MKITIISPAYPFRGGIAQSTGMLYKKLAQRNHRVNIINYRRQYPTFLFPGKRQVVAKSDKSGAVASDRLIDSVFPPSWVKTYRKIKRENSGLVIVRYWMPFFAPCLGTICWLLKRFADTKVLYICDNIIPHERRFGDVTLTRFALKRADFFILLSDFVKKDLLKLFPQARYRVVPHPVYEIDEQPIPKGVAKKKLGISDEDVILFFGLVRAYKGLDVLLQAMPAILKRMPAKLLIVGEFYEDEEKYRNVIEELKIAESVFLHNDFVENDKVGLYFSAADVLVLPYKSATQSGIVQLAYHFEKPCIVTDVGGLSEVVINERTGYVVEPENPNAVAKAVLKF
ncbi:MAG: glycosyltransferase, partial [Desulfobacterales bacterium]